LDFVEEGSSTVNLSSRTHGKKSGYVNSHDATIAQEFKVSLKKGVPLTAIKYVGVASSDASPQAALTVAKKASYKAYKSGFNKLFADHSAEWDNNYDGTVDSYASPDGTFPNKETELLQMATIASLYFIEAELRVGGTTGISVGGLTSQAYAGQVFWDQETWVFPGLVITAPEKAAAITQYRVGLHEQAIENAAQYSYPNGSSLYAWTSGRFGNCTAVGPCQDYEYHLNNDIVISLRQQYLATGDKTWLLDEAWSIINSTATTWEALLKWNTTLQKYETKNMTDPVSCSPFLCKKLY
jgi:trehalose/maltose hydrolase-like predicted phosphorylase